MWILSRYIILSMYRTSIRIVSTKLSTSTTISTTAAVSVSKLTSRVHANEIHWIVVDGGCICSGLYIDLGLMLGVIRRVFWELGVPGVCVFPHCLSVAATVTLPSPQSPLSVHILLSPHYSSTLTGSHKRVASSCPWVLLWGLKNVSWALRSRYTYHAASLLGDLDLELSLLLALLDR